MYLKLEWQQRESSVSMAIRCVVRFSTYTFRWTFSGDAAAAAAAAAVAASTSHSAVLCARSVSVYASELSRQNTGSIGK